MQKLITIFEDAIDTNTKTLDKFDPKSQEYSFIKGYIEALKDIQDNITVEMKNFFLFSLN